MNLILSVKLKKVSLTQFLFNASDTALVFVLYDKSKDDQIARILTRQGFPRKWATFVALVRTVLNRHLNELSSEQRPTNYVDENNARERGLFTTLEGICVCSKVWYLSGSCELIQCYLCFEEWF